MQRINLQTSQKLNWVQPKAFARQWELRQENQVVATMGWFRTFGTEATGELADGRFVLRQPGFFRSDVHITPEGADVATAVAKLRWRGNGEITFTDSRTYSWERRGIFNVRWQMFDQSSQQMFELTRIRGFFRCESTIQVSPFVAGDPHLPLLICFLWYLVHNDRRRAAAAVVATG